MVRTLIHASSWQRQLLEFQRRCEPATPEEEADLIREGFSLFALVPPSWGLALCRNGKRELEEMFAVGAYASAAMALLDPEINFMVSRGRRSLHFASVVLPGQKSESSGVADTLGLALLAALAAALGELARFRLHAKG